MDYRTYTDSELRCLLETAPNAAASAEAARRFTAPDQVAVDEAYEQGFEAGRSKGYDEGYFDGCEL